MHLTTRLLNGRACSHQRLGRDLAAEGPQWRSGVTPAEEDVVVDTAKREPLDEPHVRRWGVMQVVDGHCARLVVGTVLVLGVILRLELKCRVVDVEAFLGALLELVQHRLGPADIQDGGVDDDVGGERRDA